MKRQKRLWTAAAACAVLGAACRAVPGVRFAGLLFWCLTALLIVFAMLEQYKEHAWAKWGKRVLLALVCLGLVAFGYLESLVIRGAHTDGRAEDAQCVVILGAGVNGTTPSLMLSSRLQAALDFIADKPDIPIICSGGQGPGEDISEARAMYDALTDRGIDPERLILEEQSANTRQNLQNSLALLPDDYHKTVAIVTNDFHMGRVRLLLNAAGPGRVVQVPAKLPWWWLSANYYLRESFAVVNDQVVRPLLA